MLGGSWRFNTYSVTNILQMVFLGVEFLINAQGMKYKHCVFPILLFFGYILVTWSQQAIFNQPAYTKLNWSYAFG